ncbi:hypothetical protein [Prosthecomicrobium sp. N25]|uniref:hypothetical protein n=1 Tax=Prosthecomicrobium sp. N25 TaxID=3129254 RepID=UPI0030775819
MSPNPSPRPPRRRVSPRGVAETLATILIVAGVFMLMQPFSLTLYTYSFAVTLAGTALFVVGSKFPA